MRKIFDNSIKTIEKNQNFYMTKGKRREQVIYRGEKCIENIKRYFTID